MLVVKRLLLVPLLSLIAMWSFGVTVSVDRQDTPKWAYRSPISAKKRIDSVKQLGDLIEKRAGKNRSFNRALNLLRNEAVIYEPLGEDPDGNEASRVLTAAKHPTKAWFGIMPLFAADAKASKMLREFLLDKRNAIVGLDPDAPIIYVNVESPQLEKKLANVVAAINLRGKR